MGPKMTLRCYVNVMILLCVFVSGSAGIEADCISSCDGHAIGIHNDCSSCGSYFFCFWNQKYHFSCNGNLEFDSFRRICVRKSNTCPKNCVMSEWTDWSSCPVTCGESIRSRSRDIQTQPENGGQPCPADFQQTEICNESPCPTSVAIDCLDRFEDFPNVSTDYQVYESGYRVLCPPNCINVGTVWGTDVYTDDSDLCKAAIHAGKIPSSSSASYWVAFKFTSDQSNFPGSIRNGVSTYDWRDWWSSAQFY